MAQAKAGDTVKIHYTGKLSDGKQFDSTEERGPMEFKLGEGQVLPGFEEAVKGMEVGEKKNFTLSPEEGYGPRQEDLTVEVEKSEIEKFVEPQVGQQLELRQQDGGKVLVMVTDIQDDKVTLDANHPLAGEELSFDVELVDIGED